MKTLIAFLVGSAIGAGALHVYPVIRHHFSSVGGRVGLTHVNNSFEFDVHMPMTKVMPLFGAWRERAWADGWAPEFIYPVPPRDVAGEVFTVAHGQTDSVWVNATMDFDGGHVQYVYVVPHAQAVLIDIRAQSVSSNNTHVKVTYERTALSDQLNKTVGELGRMDSASGPEWKQAMESYFRSSAEIKK